MTGRVSVNAKALDELVKSARSDMQALNTEFSTSAADTEASERDFENLVRALDIKPITTGG